MIESANNAAADAPDPQSFFNSIATYSFDEGRIFHVFTAPFNITTLELQPGEVVLGDPKVGDRRWAVDAVRYQGPGNSARFKVLLQPPRPGLDTSLVLTTDRRTYYLSLHSLEPPRYMVAVRWLYPKDELAAIAEAAAARPPVREQLQLPGAFDLQSANFNYDVEIVSGHPSWKPDQVFDVPMVDPKTGRAIGRKTIIRFSRTLADSDAPVLFATTREHDVQVLSYRQEGLSYVVDGVFESAELRVGQRKQDIVKITRRSP